MVWYHHTTMVRTTTMTFSRHQRKHENVGFSQRTVLITSILLLVVFTLFWSLTNEKDTIAGNVREQRSSPTTDDPFSTARFCSINGTCHETPYTPSPRTVYSVWSQEQYDLWWKCHAQLNETALTYAKRRAALMHTSAHPQHTSRPLVLWGDSITESWLGTGLCQSKLLRTQGVPQVLEKWTKTSTFVFDPLINAISGDQTQHLLYRMQNGQLQSVVANDPNALHVVLIGTNNLGSGELPGPTAEGMLAVADYLLQHTKGFVLMLELLPRGDGSQILPQLCPPRCRTDESGHAVPFRSFLPAIDKVHGLVKDGITKRQQKYGNRVDLLNCGDAFVENPTKKEEVDVSLMPDRLHPNAAGHQILADCMDKYFGDM